MHRFRDTATYWLKIAYFSYPSYLAPTLPMSPFEFRGEVRHGKTRVMGLPCGVSFMICSTVQPFNCFCTIHPCDRQTSRRPDRIAITYRPTRYSIYAVARKNECLGGRDCMTDCVTDRPSRFSTVLCLSHKIEMIGTTAGQLCWV